MKLSPVLILFNLMFFLISSCYSQESLHVGFNSYLTYQEGNIYELGYESQTLKNEWIIGVSYISLGSRKRNVTPEGGRSSKGFGFKLEYNRVPAKLNGRGLFAGIRTDIQFVNHTESFVLSFPAQIIRYKSFSIQPSLQSGYQYIFSDKSELKAYVSTGPYFYFRESKRETHSFLMIGIRYGRTI